MPEGVCVVLTPRVNMHRNIEQRCAIKFCVKLKQFTTETFDMIREDYKDEAMSGTRAFEWHKETKLAEKTSKKNHTKDVVHKEFLPGAQTVNIKFYAEALQRLSIRVRRIFREIANTWLLHHDNAPGHTSLLVREAKSNVAKNNVATLLKAPYSPDLAPPTYFCFLGLNELERTSFLDD